MKRLISSIIILCVFFSAATVFVSAADAPSATGFTDKPDWLITEINPDQQGDGMGGWSSGRDPMEFFELYNNSGKELNLYDYCMTYNGNKRSSEKFETQIVETTPFKGPDWRDKAFMKDFVKDGVKGWAGEENLPKNPQECIVKPGEVVVVWSLYYESLLKDWNDGKGFSVKDFREFWNVPDDVKVICWDGNADAKTNGHVKNFNLKNSATGTYGIALKSDQIDALANSDESSDFYPVNYTECPELCYWVTVDFDTQIMPMAQMSFSHNFLYDAEGIGADENGLVKDTRRGLLGENNIDATPGRLNALQKMCLGLPVDAGETIVLESVYIPKPANADETFLGFKFNEKIAIPNYSAMEAQLYVLEKGGIYSFEYLYGKEGSVTTPATTSVTPSETTSLTTPVTTPVPETTSLTTPVTTPAPDKQKKGGCGSFAIAGLLTLILPAAFVIRRKKH